VWATTAAVRVSVRVGTVEGGNVRARQGYGLKREIPTLNAGVCECVSACAQRVLVHVIPNERSSCMTPVHTHTHSCA
jgi:hypothetical protein